MEEDDIFEFPPVNKSGASFISSNADVAWKQKIIEIHHKIDKSSLPDKLKDQIKDYIDQILTSAGMTNISPSQVLEFLLDWDNKMDVMKIFNSDIDTPEYHDFKRSIRMELKLQLNKSKMGWQGNHAFETHIKQDVSQTHEDRGARIGRWIGRRNKRVIEEREE